MAKKKVTPLSELRDLYKRPETAFYDTGIFFINDIWGGGIPTGKFIEVHSAEGLGKTTIVLQICRYLIVKHGLRIGYMDVEGALDISLRDSIGVSEFQDGDDPHFVYVCPYTYDEVSKTLNAFSESSIDIVVYDSIANTSLDFDPEDKDFRISKKLGQHAYYQGELLKLFKGRFARAGKTLIIINQMRSNIKMNPMSKGPDLVPAGGKVLDHNFDIRTAIDRIEWIYQGENDWTKIGAKLRVTTIKNKVAYPYRQVVLELMFGKGINKITTLFEVLKNKEIMTQKGAYFYFPNSEKSFQGRDNAIDHIRATYQELVTLVGNASYQVNILGEQIEDGADVLIGKDGADLTVLTEVESNTQFDEEK